MGRQVSHFEKRLYTVSSILYYCKHFNANFPITSNILLHTFSKLNIDTYLKVYTSLMIELFDPNCRSVFSICRETGWWHRLP